MCFFKKMFDHTFFASKKNLQPNTFSKRFSHAHVNEFGDWRAPSHCKTFGLIFRKWIGMGRPKWLINSGLDCIFLQIGLRKKKSNGWALGLTTFFLLFVNMNLKTAKLKIYWQIPGLTAYKMWMLNTPSHCLSLVRFFWGHKCQGWRAPGDC